MTVFIHELRNAKNLFLATAENLRALYPTITAPLVEKDYWIMHALWGLKALGFVFQLKGGTSLSKGFGIIDRFSEDIDIHIEPFDNEKLFIGKNHDEEKHIRSRSRFFNNLVNKIIIPGMRTERDHGFDDTKLRNAGIRLHYESFFEPHPGIKEGILLEVGFDQTKPHEPITIKSWAYTQANAANISIIDNVATDIDCYYPEYTFVEKLQAISKKVRQQQEKGKFNTNFLRHFYDIYKLLHEKRVIDFIGTDAYLKHKQDRFGKDEQDLTKNLAFNLDKDRIIFDEYVAQYKTIKELFISAMPTFETIFEKIAQCRERL
jgi:predicted nucleotidyltransferase component of viral defense system